VLSERVWDMPPDAVLERLVAEVDAVLGGAPAAQQPAGA